MSGEIPNPLEWHLVSDKEIEDYWESEDFSGLHQVARPVFLCPACGRIWVFWNGYEGDAVSYARESD
ncbi:hypothetical protein [Streptomyces spongiae]|uniref:Uncharacterized protein n=1 Tax=Streptomyces spongiae TaxID=565072 RepID=A0A5N8XKF1_9ACTN|nr:hypothetical protein [Streptomyces spongiae]MPY59950.1 hypothetical protein [Streptomyces spongiae]